MKDLLPQGIEVPDLFRNPGQLWRSQKKACYKCENFLSNMPLTGRCKLLENGPQIMSADEAKGDTCPKFELRAEVREAVKSKSTLLEEIRE